MSKGWIEPLVKIKPHREHNHMTDVTFYRSCLFDEVERWTVAREVQTAAN